MSEQKITCKGCGSKWLFVGVGNQIVARLVEDVKAESRRLWGNGRRCCANQLLHVAAGLERELVGLKLERSERGVRRG